MLEAGLIASRFAHYLAASLQFGLALFPFYFDQRGAPREAAAFATWWRRSLLWATAGSLVSAIAWFAFATANMNDDLRAAADPAALINVLHGTSFGRLWALRLLIGLAALGVAFWRSTHGGAQKKLAALILSCAVLVTLAGTGHTRENQGLDLLVHCGADIAHLLAAGVWLGGLVVLGFLVRHQLAVADEALHQFSGIGSGAVATLIASGLVNAWFLVGSPQQLTTTLYGQLLLIKLCLFLGMVLLAAANRFWLLPALARGQPQSLQRLKKHIVGEQVLGVIVLLIVAVIGTIEPAVSP